MLGTGRLLATQDVGSTDTQTFYAIVDGTQGAFNNAITTPVTRSKLSQVKDLLNGVSGALTTKGWYYDLTGSGERVVIDSTLNNGLVGWAGLLPSTDPCSPSGTGRVYAVDFSNGKTAVYNVGTGAAESYYTVGYAVNNLEWINGGAGPELLAGDTYGDTMKVPTSPASSITTKLLNWTEIPTVQ